MLSNPFIKPIILKKADDVIILRTKSLNYTEASKASGKVLFILHILIITSSICDSFYNVT